MGVSFYNGYFDEPMICDACGSSAGCEVQCPSGGLDLAEVLLLDLRVVWGDECCPECCKC